MDKLQNTFWFVFCGGSLLLKEPSTEDGHHSIPYSPQPPTETKEWTSIISLPEDTHGTPRKAYSINTPAHIDGYIFVGLRESYNRLSLDDYNIAGKAYELLYWDNNTKYCGLCGAPMRKATAISKQCTHCGKEVWPQVSPAIIVRIRKSLDNGTEQILLVHARNFRRSDMYGLVAGFVETGETLEDCVKREVEEETHLQIKNIQYFGSQSWPYPCGIMIGFTADYAGGQLQLQQEELSNAGWFTSETMPEIPDKMSIARRLIDDWLTTTAQGSHTR